MLGHNQSMLVAAIDTTTRLGSLAIVSDERVLATYVGDGGRPHATRLPVDLLELLGRHNLAVSDVDVFAVVTGPGSFTGLRIGLAAVQGLAFASAKPVVGVSAFDALAAAVWSEHPETADIPLAIWLDGQRREVFAAVVRTVATRAALSEPELEYVEAPSVALPSVVLGRWVGESWWGSATFAGDGTLVYGDMLAERLSPPQRVIDPTPLLSPAAGLIAVRRALAGLASAPHAVKPIYVRRPDAELARARQRESGA